MPLVLQKRSGPGNAPAFYVVRDNGEVELFVGSGDRYESWFLQFYKAQPLRAAYDWVYAYKILGGALRNVTRIRIVWPCIEGDQEAAITDTEACFLLRLFPRLKHLELIGVEECPQTLLLVQRSLRHLESLTLVARGGPFKLRRNLVSSRPNLCEITLQCSARPSWNELLRAGWLPVLDEIRSNPNLKKVVVVYNTWMDDRRLQFGPRIQSAIEKHLNLSDVSGGNWIDGLLSVKDRFDCFHYLASLIIPTVCVQLTQPAALAPCLPVAECPGLERDDVSVANEDDLDDDETLVSVSMADYDEVSIGSEDELDDGETLVPVSSNDSMSQEGDCEWELLPMGGESTWSHLSTLA